MFFAADINPDAQHAVLHCKGQRGEGRNDAKQDVEVSALSALDVVFIAGPGVPAVLLLSLDDVDCELIYSQFV